MKKGLHRCSKRSEVWVLENAITVQRQKIGWIAAEVGGQEQQQRRWKPALLQLEDFPLENEWFRSTGERPDHQGGVSVELVSGPSNPQRQVRSRELRGETFTEKFGSKQENFSVLVVHGALKQC